MINIKLIETYAKILYAKSVAEKSLDKVLSNMKDVTDILVTSKNFTRFLAAPIYTIKEKLDILRPLMKQLKLEKLIQNFLETLVENNRTEYVSSIYNKLLELKLDSENITYAILTSARPFKSAELTKCKDALEKKLKKNFAISHVVDTSIIGGIILQFGSSIYDISVSSMKKHLSRLNQ